MVLRSLSSLRLTYTFVLLCATALLVNACGGGTGYNYGGAKPTNITPTGAAPLQLNQNNTGVAGPSSDQLGDTTDPMGQPIPQNAAPVIMNHGTGQLKVALLLPLSGQEASLGKSLMNAAEMALVEISDPGITLVPIDTKRSIADARSAAQKAVDSGARIILGPLFADTTRAVTEIARPHGISVISFSNDSSLAGTEGLFLIGFNHEQHIRRVMEYAAKQGIRTYSTMVPRNRLGELTRDEVQRVANDQDLTIRLNRFYENADAGLSGSIKDVIAPDASSPTGYRAEGLILPEGGQMLIAIATRMGRMGSAANRFRLLGSGQWDDDAFAEEPKLWGAWFASSPPAERKAFENRFRENFGYGPLRIASLAYDAVALSVVLGRQNDFSPAAITSPQGFYGVNGAFRFGRNGVAERALAVVEITQNGFQVVDPAPESFY